MIDSKRFQSEFVHNNHSNKHNCTLVVEDLINELDTSRSKIKEKIRIHRARIKEEGELHSQYGIEIETRITQLLSEANLSRQAVITNKNKSKCSYIYNIHYIYINYI